MNDSTYLKFILPQRKELYQNLLQITPENKDKLEEYQVAMGLYGTLKERQLFGICMFKDVQDDILKVLSELMLRNNMLLDKDGEPDE